MASMIALRIGLGLLAAALFLAFVGPARRLAQLRGWRVGREAPVWFHRLLCKILRVRLRRFGTPSAAAKRLTVANHVSWLDIPVLGAIEPMTFLAKKEIGGPFLGRQAALLQGVVFVDRERRGAIPKVNDDMAEAMRAGEPVVLFAEATTGDGNRLLRFRSSHFQAIRLAHEGDGGDAVVQPVFLHYRRIAGMPIARIDRPMVAWYGEMTFIPHLWRVIFSGGIACDVYYGDPLPVGADQNRKFLARATEQAVRRLARQAREADCSRCEAIPATPETG
jgi:1-acyl-sn-glycerol-3-phosphate acyltransferase